MDIQTTVIVGTTPQDAAAICPLLRGLVGDAVVVIDEFSEIEKMYMNEMELIHRHWVAELTVHDKEEKPFFAPRSEESWKRKGKRRGRMS